MDTLTAARAQMEVSLAFHMLFAAVGIGMPLLLLIAEGMHLRTGLPHWKTLAKRQAKVTAVLFAVGAVSGTALSFELGLLWPRFMRLAGPVVGPTFALEGYAFFVEAIFLGMYLYGWDRLSPRAHWWTGVPVALSGLLSGIFVVAVNAWMQTPPSNAVVVRGSFANVDPWATFGSPAWAAMALHSSLACYASVGFAVAATAAWSILRGDLRSWHRPALRVAMVVGAAAALAQMASGDLIARMVARTQPVKLAAMEAHFETSRGAPILIGGIVDVERATTHGALRVPRALSLLVAHDPEAEVRGLREFPRDQWPNVAVVHTAFDIMVGAGSVMAALSLVFGAWWLRRGRRGANEPRWLLRSVVACGPLGFIALQAGWVVTEVGRQPWTIHGILRTADAVTPVAGVAGTFAVFTGLYVGLGAVVVTMLRWLSKQTDGETS